MCWICFDFSDEDYESAVKALNGKLYPDTPEKKAAACGDGMFVIFFLSHMHRQTHTHFIQ